MPYSIVEYIIDNPFLILALIISIFILFIIRRKPYVEKEEYLSDTNKPFTEFNQQQKLMHKQLAEKTRKYQSGNLQWQELIDLLFDANKQYPDDEYIFKLYDLIEHEPKRGGILGVNDVDWQNYQSAVENILNRFEK